VKKIFQIRFSQADFSGPIKKNDCDLKKGRQVIDQAHQVQKLNSGNGGQSEEWAGEICLLKSESVGISGPL
jgi:hypothetical protein